MELEALRFRSGKEATLGLLLDITGGAKKFLCFTLEDQFQPVKVSGETRIPAGRYEVTLRTTGGKHSKYGARSPDMHGGMLWVRNVPGFEYILIHVGNDDDDTEGCLLVGDTSVQNVTGRGMIGGSGNAYERIYPLIADRLAAGEKVFITYTDQG